MAGLLDIFGTGGTQTLGLLGMSPEDIQRNRDDAQAQALYGLAARLFQGGNTGQSIAEGLQQGQKLYSSAMQNQLQEQVQGFQMKDLLDKRKREQEALTRQAQIDRAIAGSYQPAVAGIPAQEIYGEDIMGQRVGNGMTPAVAGRAAGLDFQALAPVLMASPQGRKTLSELVTAQKGLAGDTFSLAEGAKQYSRDPFTGAVTEVASGAPKVAKLTGKEGNAALMFYGTDDVSKLRNIPGAVDKIRIEATTQRKAEQPQINLADPTAVQTQQLKTINQWEGVLKDSGAAETAMRAQGFYAAYEQAQKGNTNADGAMIYNVAKVYDPAGAVQAGDVSTVLGSRSVPENIKSYAQKLTTGGTLTPKERENMKKIIDTLVVERKKMIEPSLNTYRGVNKRLGGDDSAINNPFDMVKQPKSLEEILGLRPRGSN
jgi:hypothetical protein